MNLNYCYYATHNHYHALDHSDFSDPETASASSSQSSSDSYSISSPPNLPRRMDLADLDMIKLINTGGSGKVYLVRDRISRQHLALKVIPKSKNVFTCNKAKVMEEKNVHSFLTMESDEFILPLVATWDDRENYYLASEYIPGGDLALRIMQQRTFDEAEARFYIAELVVALERLHKRRIIHRDIKPSNILIRQDGHIVLADFGVSKRFSSQLDFEADSTDTDDSFYADSDESSSNQYSSAVDASTGACEAFLTSDDCGTPYFMSPEQHRGDKYSFEIDYWALGVILYRMVCGKMPFGDCAVNKGQISRSVLEDDVSFVGHSSTVSMVTQDFILRLLSKNPSHRLHPSEIRRDPFFYGIDWSLVERGQLRAPWLPFVAPIPKYSRAIFAGYREQQNSVTPMGDADSFAWYSPYARLKHQPRFRAKEKASSGDDVRPTLSLSARCKSLFRAVLCGASSTEGSTGIRRRGSSDRGWIAV